MGAFYLYDKNTDIDKNAVLQSFNIAGFREPYISDIGDYKIFLFEKQLINAKNHRNINGNQLFVCGSLFYKAKGYNETLDLLLHDLTEGSLEMDQLYGNYVIIFYNGRTKEIQFRIDPAFIKNVYFDTESKIISSNFLPISKSADDYTLNRNAIIENMTTGSLISPDTYINEINKLDNINIAEVSKIHTDIQFLDYKDFNIECQIYDRSTAIKDANDRLSTYFRNATELTNEYGAHIGLTGGFDSRLILMNARNSFSKLITNSFWRPNSLEFANAKKLAEAANIAFNSFEENKFTLPDINEMLEENYFYFDGQIRSQNNWNEEFNLADYTAKIASNHFVGFHGTGGEQYRNADRMMGRMTLDHYIKYEWMHKQCPNVILDKELHLIISNSIKTKIQRQIKKANEKIEILDVKRIQNEIWNKANRTTRVNVLNQQQFYFAPFTEAQISYPAYNYIPFLGNSLGFQIDMMRIRDPELCKVTTNYSFDLLQGENIRFRMLPYLYNIIPRVVFNRLHHYIKGKKSKINYHKNLEDNHCDNFKRISEGIDLSKLGKNSNLGPGMLSFNIMLEKINAKL